ERTRSREGPLVRRYKDEATHHGRCLHCLWRAELACCGADGIVLLLSPLQGAELSQLSNKLGVVLRLQGVLVIQLSNQQLHECILAQLVGVLFLLGSYRILIQDVVGTAYTIHAHVLVLSPTHYCPSVSTRCIMVFAESITSTFI